MTAIQPAAAQGDGETYSVTVRKFECPQIDGFDPYAADLNGLFSNCDSPHTNVPFNLSTDDPNYQGGNRNTGDDGGSDATWSGIPLGSTFTLQEDIPDGYGLPMIACLAYSAPWDANAGAANPGFSFGEGSVSAFIPEAYGGTPYIGCYWFNVPSAENGDQNGDQNGGQQGGAGTITIRKYTCWVDVPDLGSDPVAFYDDYIDACPQGYPGAQFQVSADGNETYSLDQNGQFVHEGFAGGPLEIREFQPHWPHPVLAVAFCTVSDPNGGESERFVPPMSNSLLNYELDPGYSLSCDWFDFFVPATVVYKYTCPDDRDYREPEFDELLQACAPQEGYRFSLTQSPEYEDDEANTDSTGMVAWTYENHQDGEDYSTTIEELDGSEYRYKRIYCTTAMPGQYPVVTYAAEIESSSITYDHPGRAQVACAWFNILEYDEENGGGAPTGDTGFGQVILFKYVCGESYPENGAYEDWQAACSDDPAVSGYEYQLTGEGGYESTKSTGQNGRAGWDDAPSGPLTLTEMNLTGYRTGAVFCGTAPLNVEPTELPAMSVTGNSVELDLQADYLIGCLWFNVPDTGNGATGESLVYVYKYVCGEDYPENGSYEDWQAACANSFNGSGYEFTLTDDAGYNETRTTDDSGMAMWDDAPYGELAIIETFANGYRTGAVFCGSSPASETPEPVTPEAIQDGNRSGFDRQDGYTTVCAWFNVPAEFGRIEIYKYYCEPGYDETSLSKEYLESICSPEPNVGFEYFGPSGGDSATTDDDGFFSWEDLEPGSYEIYEYERPEYQVLRVYCAVIYDPNESPSYEETEFFGWQLPYDLPSGGTLRCYWFNVDAFYGYIEIYKYYCEPGYDETSLSKEYLESYCSPQEGVDFDYSGPNGSDSGTTDTDGYIRWDDIPAGGYEFFETPHNDYRPFRVYCSQINAATTPYDEVPLDEWSIFYDLPYGHSLSCYWFNTSYTYGAIEIYKYFCEPGYDESSLTKEYLESYCSPEEDVTFEYSGPSNGGPALSTDEDGYVRWDDIGPGYYEISELERDGYRPYRVYCALVAVPNGEPPYEEAPLSGWTVGYDIPEGATLTCYWFNIAYEEGGRVIFHKYLCDDQLDETSLGFEYLRSYCTEPHEEIRYDVEWSDGSSDWQETDSDGYIEWESAPTGPFNAYENVPTGYRLVRVYCNHYLPDTGPDDDEWSNTTQGTNQMFWGDLWDGYVLECYWFNVPYEDIGYGSVTIYKYLCPDDYDPSSTDANYYYSYCTTPHEGVQFELVRESDDPRGGTVGTDGTVYWPDVDWGEIEISETLEPGYIAVRIWCSAYPRDGVPGSYEGVSVYNGRSMSYHLPEGYSLTCYWYNAPYEDEYGTVTIYKYVCDEGYDHGSLTREYLESYCVDPHEDIDYDLYYEHDDPITMTTSGSGEATWEEVYGGSLRLFEYVPDGYTILRVYCSAYPISGSPGAYTEMPVSEGASVYYDLPYGYSLVCYWYNTPVYGGWIEITKYGCPSGYDPEHASYQDYDYACQQRIEGVEFFLDRHDEDESQSETSDSSGFLRFEPLEYGAYYDVVETYPDEYNAAVVYCSRYTPQWGGEGPWQQYAVYNGAITVSLHEGEYLKCRWYNLYDEYGVYVRITKYDCVEDAWEYNQEDLFQECDSWMSNVRFYVNSGSDRISGITSAEGEVAWEGVAAGLIRVEESPPEGYGNRIRVYCRVIQGDQVGEWEEASVYDGIAIEYGMAEGNTLDCYWFNFPVDEGAYVTVYKYHCPATADQHSTSLASLKGKCVPLTGMRLTLAVPGQQGISRITGENGIAAWQGVPAGEIAIAEQYVFGYRTPIVYCSLNSDEAERVFSGGSSIEYELDDQDELRCDWFNLAEVSTSGSGQGGGIVIINNSSSSSSSTSSSSSSAGSTSTSGGIFTGGGPTTGGGSTVGGGTRPGGGGGTTTQQGAGPATLTIIKYVCPPGIDLEDPTTNPGSACDETEEPVSFNLRAWEDAGDEDGVTRQSAPPNVDTVTFNNLEAGDYILTELPEEDADIAWAFVLTCQSSLGQADSSRFYPLAMTRDNLSLHLTLYAGERLTCHWYNVPGGGAAVSLTVYECPGQVANPAQCDIASSPHEVVFASEGPGGASVTVETDASGSAETELAPGTYSVEDSSGNTCLVDSNALDDSNNLVIDGSVPVEVVIYTCAA